eukprot:jgi/Picsp_1/889/NSC_04376-R1_conserved domain
MSTRVTNVEPILAQCPGAPYSNINARVLCKLWKGYGEIMTVQATDCNGTESHLVIKQVHIPGQSDEELGEDHLRKVRSYSVESVFYREMSDRMNSRGVIVPTVRLITGELDTSRSTNFKDGMRMSIVMDDLRTQGYCYERKGNQLSLEEGKAVLSWLAKFHAVNWQSMHTSSSAVQEGLWPEATFWQLDSRSEEFKAIDVDWIELKYLAKDIHDALRGSKYRTIIHGDAKAANFFFIQRERGQDVDRIAGYDFQYCGFGDAMRDVAYFLSCSIKPGVLYAHERNLLEYYHSQLVANLTEEQAHGYSLDALQNSYKLCLVDLARFMAGSRWWGNVDYLQTRAREWLRSNQSASHC